MAMRVKLQIFKKNLIRKCFHNDLMTLLVFPLLYFKGGYNISETKKVIKKFYGEDLCKKTYSNLYKDIIYCILKYNVTAEEYILYNFKTLNDKGRSSFLSVMERDILIHSVTDQNTIDLLRDKYKTYELYKSFYKRDAIKLIDKNDSIKFLEFSKKHKEFVIKPLNGTWGVGVKIIKVSDFFPDSLFNELIIQGEWIIEEKITQVPFFEEFNPSSINTIRILTITKNGKCNFIFGLLRFGLNDIVTDNFSTGGSVASIDIATGIIKTPAYNKTVIKEGKQGIIINPNSNKPIIGLQIPQWKELLCIVEECTKVLPNAICVGWDFALTDKGWCMIEANGLPGCEGVQLTEHIGIRKIFINHIK